MSFLFLIPARGGSKRIKNKNLVKLNKKPLIHYTLNLCKKFSNIETVISTDNKKIKQYCMKKGFMNIHNRSKNLAKDKTSMIKVIIDYLNYLSKNKIYKFKYLILLQPTSPLRTFDDLKKSINYFKRNKLESLASISKMREHPFECVEKKGNKWSYLSQPKKKISISQKYQSNFFFIDGSIFISSFEFIRKHKSLVVKGVTNLHKTNNNFAIDIDYKEELLLANYKLNKG